MDLDTFGGRRFVLTLGCGVATTALCWFAKISGEVYATVIIATVAAFITGNVAQKIKAPQSE
jgi:hypothetical protein